MSTYNLVHITTAGEYKTPLVASQLFDQAELQAVDKTGFAPGRVEAWVIGAFREYFDKDAQARLATLKDRCPHITIRMANGISRLKNKPVLFLLKKYRRELGKLPVIYHCRGERAAIWAVWLQENFPQDRVILDVRGYWPAESIYRWGIEDPALATGRHKVEYDSSLSFLKDVVGRVSGVTTVSKALKDLLIAETGAPLDTAVVPCCVNKITTDQQREAIRNEWGVAPDEIAVVYSGTTAAYQHLEDLTIPFMKSLAEKNSKVRLVFLSSEVDKITKMLEARNMDTTRIVLKSLTQKEVAPALTACDAGILIRKPTLVNRVANPVKIAEYLAAGLPIIIERGVGGVDEEMYGLDLLHGITIAAAGSNIETATLEASNWLNSAPANRRDQVRAYVKKNYYWPSAIQLSRKLYQSRLG